MKEKKDIFYILRKAIEIYNKYRAPEAIAEIISVEKDTISVKFTGHFCRTCGVVDWIEDLKYILEDLGLKVNLVDVQEPENMLENWRIGIFKVVKGNCESYSRADLSGE